MTTRPAIMTMPAVDAGRAERHSVQDFLKILDELRALKNRLLNLDLSRLDDDHKHAVENAVKGVDRKARSGSPEEVQRLQQEARRFVDAEHERSKEMINAKFQRLDGLLLSLGSFLKTLGPVKELEAKIAEKDDRLKKLEDELKVQRKVLSHEQEELEREKQLLHAAEDQVRAKTKELEGKLANLDVVKRAKELDQVKEELDGKVKAFAEEEARIAHERQELNADLDKLGQQSADLEREADKLIKDREDLEKKKSTVADVVAREMAATFESFVRDMLRPQPKDPPA
jgi:chromosome segregation ATPase